MAVAALAAIARQMPVAVAAQGLGHPGPAGLRILQVQEQRAQTMALRALQQPQQRRQPAYKAAVQAAVVVQTLRQELLAALRHLARLAVVGVGERILPRQTSTETVQLAVLHEMFPLPLARAAQAERQAEHCRGPMERLAQARVPALVEVEALVTEPTAAKAEMEALPAVVGAVAGLRSQAAQLAQAATAHAARFG